MRTAPATDRQRNIITKSTDSELILLYRATVRGQRRQPNGSRNQRIALIRNEAKRRGLELKAVKNN